MKSFSEAVQEHAGHAQQLVRLAAALKDGPTDLVLRSEQLNLSVPATKIDLDDFRQAVSQEIVATINQLRDTWQVIDQAAQQSTGQAVPAPVSPATEAPVASPGASRVIRS